MNTKAIGDHGEDLAVKYLLAQGCRILDRNFRSKNGEIDIIAEDGAIIVFIEVKTRHGGGFGTPGEAVTLKKQQKIIRTAQFYLNGKKKADSFCRFDVLEVYYKTKEMYQIRWLKEAFEAE